MEVNLSYLVNKNKYCCNLIHHKKLTFDIHDWFLTVILKSKKTTRVYVVKQASDPCVND
jgi:hypothetical protein